MKLQSIKEYATSNKLSIYNVVKMTKNGKLKIEIKKLNGKDEVFICVDETDKIEPLMEENSEEVVDDFEKAYYKLKIQYNQLKRKYENLQKKI